jgi:hypothetical protein
MIRHVVLLNWNEGVSEAAVEAVTEALDALPAQIPEIRAYRFGPDLGLSRQTADYVLVADFDTEADFHSYVVHPAHIDLMKNVTGPIIESYGSAQFHLPPA